MLGMRSAGKNYGNSKRGGSLQLISLRPSCSWGQDGHHTLPFWTLSLSPLFLGGLTRLDPPLFCPSWPIMGRGALICALRPSLSCALWPQKQPASFRQLFFFLFSISARYCFIHFYSPLYSKVSTLSLHQYTNSARWFRTSLSTEAV